MKKITLFAFLAATFLSHSQEPAEAAPTPTQLPADVISMFSNAYNNVPVDTWQTSWSVGTLTDLQIAGNDTKKYTGVSFVGVETVGPNMIDASEMTFFHVDIWTPNMTTFRVKLVDFGADGAFAGGDDSEHEVIFTSPAASTWISYDIPMAQFVNLTSRSHIAQLIFSGDPAGEGILYVDNVYFKSDVVAEPEMPTVAAPTPTRDAANVISLFSNAYTNVAVDTWRTSWSSAALEDVQIAGNDTKEYTNLDFVGIETVGPNAIDASNMLYFHVDMWTPNITTFRVKLVDFGSDNAFGGGNDTEHEVVFTDVQAGMWNSLDIPMSDFVNLTSSGHISQLIFSGLPIGAGTVYIDNVYFSNQALGTSSFVKNAVAMYPNPTSGLFTVNSDSPIEKISVFNLRGQELLTKVASSTNEAIDLSGFASGVYLVKSTSNNVTTAHRVVKQ